METVEVESLVIDYRGEGYDGDQAHVIIDGKMCPDMTPPRWEEKIALECIAYEKVKVTVWYRSGEAIVYNPRTFSLRMGRLYVYTAENRFPCGTVLGDEDIKSYSLKTVFAKGEVPWVELKFTPHYEGKPYGNL